MRRSRGRRGRSRGAVAVEAAIIAPLLIALTFGTFEFGLLYRDNNILNQAARAGGRMGSTLPRDPNYHMVTASVVAKELAGRVPDGAVETLILYKADRYGNPVGASLDACTTTCYRFTWDATSEEFDLQSGAAWDYTDQEACGVPFDNDYLGVRLDGYHEWLTKILGEGTDISASAVFRLEPVTSSEACK